VSLPLKLPEEVGRLVFGARWTQVALGCSRSEVYRFESGLYLKTVVRDAQDEVFGSLAGEAGRLQALQALVPVPRLMLFVQDHARDYLMVTEVVGQHAASALSDDAVHGTVAAVAAACQRLHRAEVKGFPFVEGVGALLAQVEKRVALGLVDAADFDDERLGRSPEDLFEELCGAAPDACEAVLTHGDLDLSNMIVNGSTVTGFVDVGRAAISDPWRDLALCLRSLEAAGGKEVGEEFLRLYGVERDAGKEHFYTLLDEFF
jgi:aminoglycoside 3'-phosphotransferase-2